MSDTRFDLPRFQEALKEHSKTLSAGTYWRYVNGLLPAFGQFLIREPELLEALAEDARELAVKSGGAMLPQPGKAFDAAA